MPGDLVLHELRDGVAALTLNRPEALNAWTPDLGRELLARVREAAADPAARAILVSGAGRAFSAGADVKVPRELLPGGEPDLSTRLREIYNPMILALREAPKPVVCAVQGAAAGLGFSLAMAADLVVASESAYFLLAFVRLGVIPDGGVLAHLVERIGSARTSELMMLGERLPAQVARDWGLVNRIVADEELPGVARGLAEQLAAGPTVALATMKEALRGAAARPLAEQLEREAALQQRQAATADYAEGVAAFKEKRRARFTGA
jgi:2-(1,2-epoxy-1,2-dihydrophenyl)acetyl-CoA isomerase